MDSKPLQEKIGEARQDMQGLLDSLPACASHAHERLTSALAALRQAVDELQRVDTDLRDDQAVSCHVAVPDLEDVPIPKGRGRLADTLEHSPAATTVGDNELPVVHASRSVTERMRTKEKLLGTEAMLRSFVENANDIIYSLDLDRTFFYVSPNVRQQLGFDPAELLGRPYAEFVHADNLSECDAFFQRVTTTGESQKDLAYQVRCKDGSWRWHTSNASALKGDDGAVVAYLGISRDVTDRAEREAALREAEDELRRIEWLLTHRPAHGAEARPDASQPYGDLTKLNTCRTVLDAVGRGALAAIAEDALDMLGTSTAVYEANGDYALGIFTSGWCQFLDASSRRLCDTTDDAEALCCGRWHCHESCWNNASRVAIETGEAVDIECLGGIRLYAVPIRAGAQVVGAINCGYGDPPTEASRLSEIASRYCVPVEQLRAKAAEYETRPPFITDLAKRRLNAAARLIGEVVERHQVKEALRESERKFRALFERSADAHVIFKAGRFVDCNPACLKMLGLDDRSDLLGHDPADISPEVQPDGRDSREKAEEMVAAALAKGSHRFEWTCRRRDGELVLLDVLLNAITLQGENAIHAVWRDITERRRAEEAVRDANLRVNEAVTAGNVGLWDWDLATNNVHYSAEWKSQIGYAEHEIGAGLEEWRSRVHPDDLQPTLEHVNRCIAEGRQEHHVEFRFRHKDGSYRWIMATGSVVQDETGQPIRMHGAHVDITDRKHAEDQLRAAHARLQALWGVSSLVNANMKEVSDHILATIARMTGSQYSFYGFMNADESVMTIHSWSGEAMKDCAMVERPQEFPISTAGIWGEAIRRRAPLILNNYESPDAAKKGLPQGHVPIENLLVVPHFAEGRIVAVAAVANRPNDYSSDDVAQITAFLRGSQAIVEKTQAQDRLKGREALLNAVGRMAKVGGWELDADTLDVSWTDETYHIHEVPIGKKPSLEEAMNFFHPDDREGLARAIRRALDEGEPYDMEVRFITAKGRHLWTRTICEPEVKDGKTVILKGTFQDVTERRSLEEQLRHAQKLEAVGQLASGIAHDFNNLLTAITGYAEVAGDVLDQPDEARSALAGVKDAVRQASGVTRSLLTFTHKMPVDKQRVNLVAAVAHSIKMLRHMLPAQIHIVDHLSDEPVWIHADATQIQQVVMNLAVNARDAMLDGGTLSVSVSPVASKSPESSAERQTIMEQPDSPGMHARLVVGDTGIGIRSDVKERMFEPFYTTKPRGQGTGLGLSIIHGIVEEHSGRIKVESELGKGATFTIDFPALTDSEAAHAPKPHRAANRGSGELVLLAEDDWHVRTILTTTLESFGYTVMAAETGPGLMALFEQQRDEIRLIVTDVDLPGRSGLVCLRDIRAVNDGLPVIVITGNVDVDTRSHADERTVLLQKPFRMAELGDVAGRLLSGQRQEEQPR